MPITEQMLEEYYKSTESRLDEKVKAVLQEVKKNLKENKNFISDATSQWLASLISNQWNEDAYSTLVQNGYIVGTQERIVTKAVTMNDIKKYPIVTKVLAKVELEAMHLDIPIGGDQSGLTDTDSILRIASMPLTVQQPDPPPGAAPPAEEEAAAARGAPQAPEKRNLEQPIPDAHHGHMLGSIAHLPEIPSPAPEPSPAPAAPEPSAVEAGAPKPQVRPQEVANLDENQPIRDIYQMPGNQAAAGAPAAAKSVLSQAAPQAVQPPPTTKLQAMHNFVSNNLDTAVQSIIKLKEDKKWTDTNTQGVFLILKRRAEELHLDGISKGQIDGIVDGFRPRIRELGTQLASKLSDEQLKANKKEREDIKKRTVQEEQSKKDADLAKRIAQHDQEVDAETREANEVVEPPRPNRGRRLVDDEPISDDLAAALAASLEQSQLGQPQEDELARAMRLSKEEEDKRQAKAQKEREQTEAAIKRSQGPQNQEEDDTAKAIRDSQKEEAERQAKKAAQERQNQEQLETTLRLSREEHQRQQTTPQTSSQTTAPQAPSVSFWQQFLNFIQSIIASIKSFISNLGKKETASTRSDTQSPASSPPAQTAASSARSTPSSKQQPPPANQNPKQTAKSGSDSKKRGGASGPGL